MIENLNKLPRWLVLEIAVPLALLNGWLLYQVFQTFQTPFTIVIVAILLEFLLNYPIELLEKRGIGKGVSIALILLGAVALVSLLGLILLPILVDQLGDLARRFPDLLATGSQQFQSIDEWLTARRIPLDVTAVADKVTRLLPRGLVQLPDRALEILLGLADSIVEVLATVVLTLYLIFHGDTFWRGLIVWLPEKFSDSIRPAFQKQFRNYFVGQATIASIMVVVLTTLFFIFKIPYWLVFGVSIGLLALIPLGDIVGILAAAAILSFKSVLLGAKIIAIAFVADQIIDNAIAPKILGDLIGLNPVWIIISLLVGAQTGGILGLLLAVPLAGSLKRILLNLFPEKESLPTIDSSATAG
ncbi:MAG: AI-2E family transporter [Nodosilinea sp.]